MKWRKLGKVYAPDGSLPWARTYAYIPTARSLDERTIRVYVAFLDEDKVGRIAFVDVSAADPTRVLRVADKPVLDIGEPGAFDEWGVTPMSVVEDDGDLLLYYMGWQRCRNGRYTLLTGLAASTDGGEKFQRVKRVPVLDRSEEEMFIRSAANVRRENGLFRMWYVAGSEWISLNGKEAPTYGIRYLESVHGCRWSAQGSVCIEPNEPEEYGFGRPFVLPWGDGYCMWYSIRTRSMGYRLGYAKSEDGTQWERKDGEIGIDVSQSGWDSEMICFPCVMKTEYGVYMFYNGNNYGETGFGVAVLEHED